MISYGEGKGDAPKKEEVEMAYQLRLTVVGVTPAIWRRLLVKESMWLSRLHDSIQISFDWFDYQLHRFLLDTAAYGNPARRDGVPSVEDDRDITLAECEFPGRQQITYEYDFGEGWKIEVHLEKTFPAERRVLYPLCVAGERAGPPEDCGSVEAYNDMMYALQNPQSDLGKEWLQWLGDGYDPERCDLKKINKALRALGKD